MAYALRRTAHHLTVVLGPQQTHMLDAEGRWARHDLVDWCTSMVKKDDVVVDVGAHMGLFALVMAAHCRQVHAIEASYTSYQQLCANALVNHAPHVRARHAMLFHFVQSRRRSASSTRSTSRRSPRRSSTCSARRSSPTAASP